MPFDKGLDTGRIYTFTQLLTALTTAPNDLVSLLASSISRVEILAVELCQGTSTPAPATIEMYRGSTGVSAGAAVPAANRDGITAAQPALSSASGFSATQLSTASAQRIHAAAFDSVSGNYKWEPCFPPSLEYSQRFHARISGPLAANVPMAVTLTIRELGSMPR